MNKKIISVFLLAAMLLSLAGGCGSEKKDGECDIYYLNADVTTLIKDEVKTEHSEGKELILDLIEALKDQPKDANLRPPIPTEVEVRSVETSEYQISVDFSQEYSDMESIREILTRAAIVKTLLQNTEYLYVIFTVEGEPLSTQSGSIVGAMGLDSFVENPGQQINSSQVATLTLYFANADGTGLVPETRQVHYSSNTSVDKLVMEQLIEGPKSGDDQATIPTGTRLITISTVDGVCYVNFDETFFNQNQEITEQVVLYSIVDSLTELQSIDRVQLSVNGDTTGKVRFTYDLSTMYEENLDLVVSTQKSTEEGIEATE